MTEEQENLTLKYLQGTLSPAEQIIFESWLSESDVNRKMIGDYERVWLLSEGSEKVADFQREQEWARLQISLSSEKKVLSEMALNKRRSYVLRIAASLGLLIFSFALYWVAFRSREIVRQATGRIEHVILPDGSEVWLNEKSRLVYRSDFGNVRDLALEGEGFFEVKPDPEKPFVVHTDQVQVKVLGTSFNVKAYKEELQTEVFVLTGKVSFSSADNISSVTLLPGSNGIFNKKEHTMTTEKEHLNAMMWKEKRLVFKKTPLREVVRTLRTYFKADIRVKNEMLMNCRFTSSFNDPTLSEVIDALRLALNLKLDHHDVVYDLDGQGCNAY